MKTKRKKVDSISQKETKETSEIGSTRDEHIEEMIDEAIEGTFPCSDPPPWTLGREDTFINGIKKHMRKDI